MQLSKKAKVFRDPVHDIISYEREGDFGRLMTTLIDAPEFQRLRFVRQLGLASLVFHGAEHSRFAHSMGVAHLTRRMYDQLHVQSSYNEGLRITTSVAGLLHDIGHGPFSHALERVFGFSHEKTAELLIKHPDSTINQILRTFDSNLPEQVSDTLAGKQAHYSHDLVSSQLDADRFDYLLRDSHMTGVEVGRYDLERILLMLERDEQGLLVNIRAFESIEGYLVARYHMYRLVYFHRAVRAAESMLQMMFVRARDLMQAGTEVIGIESTLGRLMLGTPLCPLEFNRFSEIDAWARIREWSTNADPILAELAESLVERRLFRSIERDIQSAEQLLEVRQQEAEIRNHLDERDRYLFVVDVARDEPYRPYWPGVTRGIGAIRIVDREGEVFAIEERSPLVRALANAGYRLRRWCFHPRLEPIVLSVLGCRAVK